MSITNGGLSYVDSPWALTSINQAQFWSRNMRDYGDSKVQDIMSAAIADWITPGTFNKKAARDRTRQEIAMECWAQIKQHVNNSKLFPVLTDADLHSWWLDPAITATDTPQAANDEPRIEIIPVWSPPELAQVKEDDHRRYLEGKPNFRDSGV